MADIHKERAAHIFNKPVDQVTLEEKEVGRIHNFRDLYMTPGHFNVPQPTREEALEFLKQFDSHYAGIPIVPGIRAGGSVTGRIPCSDPDGPIKTVPKGSEPPTVWGFQFLQLDYSDIELRLVGYMQWAHHRVEDILIYRGGTREESEALLKRWLEEASHYPTDPKDYVQQKIWQMWRGEGT